MPRVTFVKSARKDNPVAKKGESYYWWKFRYGGKRYSKTRPRPSQLTQSAYYGAVRSLIEMIEDYEIADHEDVVTLRDEVRDELDNIRSECQDSLDNMPEQLQYSPTGELLQERIDACDTAEGDLDNIDEFDYDDNEPQRSDYEEGEDGDEEFKIDKIDWLDNREQAIVDYVDNAKSEMIDAVSNCEV